MVLQLFQNENTASTVFMPPLARSTCFPENSIIVNLNIPSLKYSSWSSSAGFMFDGSSVEIGSSSTHGNGIGLETPFTINEDVPMSFETSSSLSHGPSSSNRAVSHKSFSFLLWILLLISIFIIERTSRHHLGRSGIVVHGTL